MKYSKSCYLKMPVKQTSGSSLSLSFFFHLAFKVLAFLQNEFWSLKFFLFFCVPFLSSAICASGFRCLSLGQADSQIFISSPGLSSQLQTYPSVFLTFSLGCLEDFSNSTCVKYPYHLPAPECCSSISVSFPGPTFVLEQTKNT